MMKRKDGGPIVESKRKPIDMRRAILGSDKDIVARGNRTPYEPTPKTGPDMPARPVKKDPDTLGAKKFAKGGSAMKKADKAGRALVKKSADTMGRAMMSKGGKCYAKGGSASARADGIAKKGKTKGKMFASGGPTPTSSGLGKTVPMAAAPIAKTAGSGLGKTVPMAAAPAAKTAGSGLGKTVPMAAAPAAKTAGSGISRSNGMMRRGGVAKKGKC